MTKTKRNGTIELLRMVFCLVVLFFHISNDIYGSWREASFGGVLRYGALGVEFFLIVSGYFMAKSVSKMSAECHNLGGETWSFMWKKLKPIMPYHICFNLFVILVNIALMNPIAEIVGKVSSLFFLPTLGFNNGEWAMGSEWYIGYMLFVMLIIYPFLRKFTKIVSIYIAPVLSLILYGVLAVNYGTVMGGNRMIEAFAGILLGISVFTVSEQFKEYLKNNQLGKIATFILRIYPVAVIVCVLLYINSSLSTSIQPFLVLILASGLAVTFAEEGLVSHSGILNNKFVYWLGKMSLPIYLVQNITRMIITNCFNIESAPLAYLAYGASTIIVGIASYYVLTFIWNKLFYRKSS